MLVPVRLLEFGVDFRGGRKSTKCHGKNATLYKVLCQREFLDFKPTYSDII